MRTPLHFFVNIWDAFNDHPQKVTADTPPLTWTVNVRMGLRFGHVTAVKMNRHCYKGFH